MAVLRRTNKEHEMPGNPRDMIMMAERRFAVRIRIGVPADGLGRRHAQITAWLDENCGSDGWAMTPSGTRGVLNNAISLYSRMRRSRARSLRGGASRPRSRRPAVCSRCARMSRRRGSGQVCTGRREARPRSGLTPITG